MRLARREKRLALVRACNQSQPRAIGQYVANRRWAMGMGQFAKGVPSSPGGNGLRDLRQKNKKAKHHPSTLLPAYLDLALRRIRPFSIRYRYQDDVPYLPPTSDPPKQRVALPQVALLPKKRTAIASMRKTHLLTAKDMVK